MRALQVLLKCQLTPIVAKDNTHMDSEYIGVNKPG